MNGDSHDESHGGRDHVDGPLQHQADLVVRRGREGQQRHRSQALEIRGAVDVREEVHGDARADAFLVAQQEDVLEFRQPLALHGEENLVDHLPAEQFGQFGQRIHLVGPAQADFAGVRLGRLRQEPNQLDSVPGRFLQFLAQSPGSFTRSDDNHEVLDPKFPPCETDQPARRQPKQEQQQAAVGAEERQEEAA